MKFQGHAGGTTRGVPRAPFTRGQALIEPEVRRSANGELQTNLRARYTYKDIGGYRLYLRSYEGSIPGPTLRVWPGEMLRIRLINELPPNPDPVPVDISLPHHFNTTNFHFRGVAHAAEPEFPPAGNDQKFTYFVCGRRFDPQRVGQCIPLGAVEEWTVINEQNADHVRTGLQVIAAGRAAFLCIAAAKLVQPRQIRLDTIQRG